MRIWRTVTAFVLIGLAAGCAEASRDAKKPREAPTPSGASPEEPRDPVVRDRPKSERAADDPGPEPRSGPLPGAKKKSKKPSSPEGSLPDGISKSIRDILPGIVDSPAPAEDPNAFIVPVYYGSNRLSRDPPPGLDEYEDFYTSRRGRLHYGVCRVSVPKNRDDGSLNTATRQNRNTAEVFVLKKVTCFTSGDLWVKEVAGLTENGDDQRHDALVFVHGYNVSFADAIYRTAQLKVDLNFAGPALAFSWPSRATLAGYSDDEASARKSVADFEAFLRLVIAGSKARRLHVIAHSMGNRVMTAALANIADQPKLKGTPIDQIILAAPDIDAKEFRQVIAPRFTKLGRRRTLYANPRDIALRASFVAHHTASRLGDSASHVSGLSIEAVDTREADTSLLAHSYYGDVPIVISDITAVLDGKSPRERNLVHQRSNVWSFKLAGTDPWWLLLSAVFIVTSFSAGWTVRAWWIR